MHGVHDLPAYSPGTHGKAKRPAPPALADGRLYDYLDPKRAFLEGTADPARRAGQPALSGTPVPDLQLPARCNTPIQSKEPRMNITTCKRWASRPTRGSSAAERGKGFSVTGSAARRAGLPLAAVMVLSAAAAWAAGGDAAPEPSPVKFAVHRIGNFRSEACAVADFNGDGKLDIVAGNYLYLAPEFKPLKIRSLKGKVDEHGKGYYNDFMNEAMDVEGTGRPGVVSVDWFSKSVYWYRNTLGQSGDWPETTVDTIDNFESGELVDLDGPGKPPVLLLHTRQTIWMEPGTTANGQRGLIKHVVSTKNMDFGGGVGDLNGDGRPDIIRPNAWFEAPADIRHGVWKEHPIALGAKNGHAVHTPQILVYDVNGDGLNDIITSNAHGYGIFWYEQVRNGDSITWKQHTIDDTWTQAHSLALGDIDGCGLPELITGKRFMAHNGNDPDAFGKLGLYYYKLIRGPGKSVQWKKYAISYDQGMGAGMNIWVGDLRGSGRLDIVTTGKFGGPVWFENQGKAAPAQ
jgi:hypothetical protein